MSRYVLCIIILSSRVNAYQICDMFYDDFDRFRYTRESEKQWGIDQSTQMTIINQESGFKSTARPVDSYLFGFIPWKTKSSALGYSQALIGTWAEYEIQSPSWIRSRVLFKDATDFVGWYLNQCHIRAGIDKNDISKLYLCYHEGVGGYKRQSFKEKPWLLKTAERLKVSNQRARAQLNQCEASLRWSHLYFL